MPVLKATKRSETGSRPAKALRAQGLIPAVVYGHQKETVSVTLNQHEVDLSIHHGQRLLEVDIDGQIENVLLKDVQWDTFGNEVLHVDLTRVNLNETVTVTVPIVLRGTPAAADEGGVLRQMAPDVEIECMVRSIPEEIRVIVNDLQIGEAIYLRDLELPDGAKLVADGDTVVCSVAVIEEEAEEAAPEEEGGVQPEVIGGKEAADEEEKA